MNSLLGWRATRLVFHMTSSVGSPGSRVETAASPKALAVIPPGSANWQELLGTA